MAPDDETIPTRAWLALFVSTLVVFLAVINISSVNVAFPSIREDFGSTDAELSWIIGAYNLVVGSLLLAAGRLSDSLGRRRVYLPGVAIFALGSVLCALAPGTWWLVGARVVQGIGGSITMAAGFAVMLPEFPPTRRSTPIGIAGAAGALGAVVGPVVGSLLIDLISWRGVFWINVPLCLLVLVLGPRYLSESKDPEATGHIDWIGVAFGTVAVASIMFAIVQTETWGLDARVVGLIVFGMALAVALIRRSAVHPEPLIDLSLFRFRSFTSANIGGFFYGLGFTAGALVSSLLLQDVWDLPIRDVGLAFAPSPLLAAAVSPYAGRWADRIGHRWILFTGCMLCAVGYASFIFAFTETAEPWSRYVPLSLFAGVGVGMTVSTWSSAGVSDVSPARFGIAGATFNTLRNGAYGLGVAIVVALIAASGEVTTLVGIERAYGFIAVCYVLSAISVAITFPAGSARDRAAAAAVSPPVGSASRG
ncbi:MAG: MFS transporter [Actinomycetota bacterium]